MTLVHFVFTLDLWVYKDDDVEETPTYPTGDEQLDADTAKFIAGPSFHNIPESIVGNFQMLSYYILDNLLHIWSKGPARLTDRDLAEQLEDMSPYGNGPDGWMEGELHVRENVELIPTIKDVYKVVIEKVDLEALDGAS